MKSLAFRSLHSDRKYLLATGGGYVVRIAVHTSGSALQPLCPVISSYLTVVIIYFLKCSAELLCHSASALKVQVKTFVRFFFGANNRSLCLCVKSLLPESDMGLLVCFLTVQSN